MTTKLHPLALEITHAARLRHRLNIAGESFVRNVWGVGYRLTDTGLAPVRA
jgi:DNA-binding response OmpR family regulator